MNTILKLGNQIIIRTVTHYYTGEIIDTSGGWIVLAKAAWIADTGRWASALRDGTLVEVEPFPGQVAVSINSVVDVSPWNHELPREQK